MNKRILLGLLASFVLAVSASAETIKIKFNDLAELGASLKSLDGVEKTVNTSDQGTRVIKTSFDLKASARIAIAKDLAIVRTALEAFETQRQLLLERVSPGAIQRVQADPALLAKFVALWNDYTKEAVAIDVVMLTEADLNLDVNKDIGGSILAGLGPILKAK
jgi:hypothetical protein